MLAKDEPSDIENPCSYVEAERKQGSSMSHMLKRDLLKSVGSRVLYWNLGNPPHSSDHLSHCDSFLDRYAWLQDVA